MAIACIRRISIQHHTTKGEQIKQTLYTNSIPPILPSLINPISIQLLQSWFQNKLFISFILLLFHFLNNFSYTLALVKRIFLKNWKMKKNCTRMIYFLTFYDNSVNKIQLFTIHLKLPEIGQSIKQRILSLKLNKKATKKYNSYF